jgi:MerR family transcriptional regulator, light-induced transcriptional regulator
VSSVTDPVLTLHEAAEQLGVHYMTAYRYVRLGQLDAVKVGGTWQVTTAALDALRQQRDGAQPSRLRSVPWSDRLESRLLAGDASGAWGVIESALAGGASVGDVYVEVLAPALHSIGDRWAAGEIDVAIEHRASGIASRLIGRLGSRCLRRGRSRGSIVLGGPAGERHSLVVAMLADLLRLEGWDVSDLGADTPATSFVLTAESLDDLVAVGISVTSPESVTSAAETCTVMREAGLTVPILLGGQAIEGETHARSLGADGYAADAASMVEILDTLSGSAA